MYQGTHPRRACSIRTAHDRQRGNRETACERHREGLIQEVGGRQGGTETPELFFILLHCSQILYLNYSLFSCTAARFFTWIILYSPALQPDSLPAETSGKPKWLIPGLGEFPGGGKWQLAPVFLPEKSHVDWWLQPKRSKRVGHNWATMHAGSYCAEP